MSNFSLMGSLRTCKVQTGWADKIQSDRFQNPSEMVCPLWNGVDTAGREVFQDSFYTKNAGCNSAEDRIGVENAVSRPQYMEYINLNASGVQGDIYAGTEASENSGYRTKDLRDTHNLTGQFGLQTGFGQVIYPPCQGSGRSGSATAYDNAMEQQKKRGAGAMENYSRACGLRRMSGF
jgi:hypothetical protein